MLDGVGSRGRERANLHRSRGYGFGRGIYPQVTPFARGNTQVGHLASRSADGDQRRVQSI